MSAGACGPRFEPAGSVRRSFAVRTSSAQRSSSWRDSICACMCCICAIASACASCCASTSSTTVVAPELSALVSFASALHRWLCTQLQATMRIDVTQTSAMQMMSSAATTTARVSSTTTAIVRVNTNAPGGGPVKQLQVIKLDRSTFASSTVSKLIFLI